jgi:hypothetical protein
VLIAAFGLVFEAFEYYLVKANIDPDLLGRRGESADRQLTRKHLIEVTATPRTQFFGVPDPRDLRKKYLTSSASTRATSAQFGGPKDDESTPLCTCCWGMMP